MNNDTKPMKLYLLHTTGCGRFYVIAESSDSAIDTLTKTLEQAEYGYRSDRLIDRIDILTEEIDKSRERLYISKEKTLIITT